MPWLLLRSCVVKPSVNQLYTGANLVAMEPGEACGSAQFPELGLLLLQMTPWWPLHPKCERDGSCQILSLSVALRRISSRSPTNERRQIVSRFDLNQDGAKARSVE